MLYRSIKAGLAREADSNGAIIFSGLVVLAKRRRGLLRQANRVARPKHRVFSRRVALQAAINRFKAGDAKLFVWKAKPDDIIATLNWEFQMLESIH